jgi:hypothetical protein
MWDVVKKAIIELIWPIFKDLIVKLLNEMSDWILGKFRTWASKRNKSNADTADAKADAHEKSAKEAKTPKEADINLEVAKVWREVAEMFRKENEALATEVKRLKADAHAKSEETIQNMAF